MKNNDSGLFRIFDILAKIFAVIALLAIIVQNLAAFSWMPAQVITVANYILSYATIILAGLTALELGTKHGWFLTIIILLVIALALIPRFIPSVWEKILNALGISA